jgi:uncharacterized protein (TIGR02118 family)
MSTNKGATVSALYPRKDGATFNLDYYLSTHMPLVTKHWSKYGLKSWSVTQMAPDAPYAFSATMEWESLEAFGNATKDEESTGAIMGDVKNFSSESPVLLAGGVVARG